ncbi:MAG: OmpH family outer membrane protein [Planctomycetes bacterium]|nr:OmpH family outer membrane protein [Planctomycetota bacterium]
MKKNNIVVLVVLASLIAVCIGYSRGWAQASMQITPAKVGVVNVDLVLKNSRKHAQWQKRMNAEEASFKAEVAKLEAEMDAILADMKTRKAGSPDHMKLMEEGMTKNAAVDSKRKFYDRKMMLEVQNWTEKLYNEIRSIVEKTAKARGLDIVLSADEIDFPAADVRDLLTIIKTNKVLYHSSRIDITEEVLAQLDSAL